MKTLTYRKAMSNAKRYIRAIKTTPDNRELQMMAAHWKDKAVALAHSEAERERAAAL